MLPNLYLLLHALLWALVFGRCIYHTQHAGKLYSFDLSMLEIHSLENVQFQVERKYYVVYLTLCNSLGNLPRTYLGQHVNTKTRAVIVKVQNSSVTPVANNFDVEEHFDGNNLYFQMKSSNECLEFGNRTLRYKISIKFVYNEKHTRLKFDEFDVKSCELLLVWNTFLASPIQSHVGTTVDCVYTYKNYRLDFNVIKHSKFYKGRFNGISKGKFVGYINFCQPIREQGCSSTHSNFVSVCLYDERKQISFTESLNKSNCYFNESPMALVCTYNTSVVNEFWKIEINLVCSQNEFSIEPQFIWGRKKITIIVKTYATCLPNLSCTVTKNNYKFQVPNYSFVKVKSKELLFLISTCGQLKSNEFWLGGNSSSVVIGQTVENLGVLRSLTVNPDTSITLTLSGGSFCTSFNRFSTKIRFICSKKDESYPSLAHSDNCTYFFEWKHSKACPVIVAPGNACYIRDPNNFNEFNLKNGSIGTQVVVHGDMTFAINLCGDVGLTCNSQQRTSICMKRNGSEIVLGKRSEQLLVFGERFLVFELFGDECRAGVVSSVYIDVVCDYGAFNISKIRLNSFDNLNCVYNFTLATRSACPSNKNMNCNVKNSRNETVDLTGLRKLASNYRVQINDTSYFLLNVCGPLWYGRGEMCQLNSAACLIMNQTQINIGYVDNSHVSVNERNEINLLYMTDFLCSSSLSVIGTSIEFKCGHKNSNLKYMGFNAGKCLHEFQWTNKNACFNKTNKLKNLPRHETITTSRPIVILLENKTSTLSLVPENKMLFKNKLVEQLTNLQNGGKSRELYEVENNAKMNLLPVITLNRSHSDMKTLWDLGQQEIKLNDSAKFYVNFHERLNGFRDVCSNSLSCLAVDSRLISLGSEYLQPVYTTNGLLQLTQVNGSVCDAAKGLKYSSEFNFKCNTNEVLSNPVEQFSETANHCVFNFIWRTSAICNVEVVSLDRRNCKITNAKTGEIVDLGVVYKIIHETKKNSKEDTFSVCDVRSNSAFCPGPLCLADSSTPHHGSRFRFIGLYNNVSNITFINFQSRDFCRGHEIYKIELRLKCRENSTVSIPSAPKVLKEQCKVVVEMESQHFCYRSTPEKGHSKIYIPVIGVVAVLLVAALIYGSRHCVYLNILCSKLFSSRRVKESHQLLARHPRKDN